MSQYPVRTSRVSTLTLQKRKRDGDKIAMITAYDFPTAQLVDASGMDVILVGDSVGMAVMGLDNTLGVTMDVMLHHVKMVSRGAAHAMVVADMPFLSYQVNPEEALRNAGRLLAEGGAQAVKLEGSVAKLGRTVEMIIGAGIPVMGHIGLTPQSVYQLGGYRVQGRNDADRSRLKEEALALQEAGCFGLVLECMPPDLAGEITQSLNIPTIGIGAGPHCDGQVLVLHDMLGWGRTTFSKTFGNVRGEMEKALSSYVEEVKGASFPAKEHCFG